MENKGRPVTSLLQRCIVLSLSLAASFATHAAAAPRESVVSVPSRPGVTQGFFLIEPENQPRAIAIMFVGGEGNLGLQEGRLPKITNNFLMRTRLQVAAAGLRLAFPDTPSDQRKGLGNFRISADHAQDIAAVIQAVKAETDLPVFLISTSRGTISAANAAARLPPGTIAGLIMSSAITVRGNRGQAYIQQLPVKDIKLPVFVIAHRDDGCYVTPPGNVASLLDAMPEAPRKDSLTLSGGAGAGGDPCGSQSAHGFLDSEEPAVKAMTDWIEAVLTGR